MGVFLSGGYGRLSARGLVSLVVSSHDTAARDQGDLHHMAAMRALARVHQQIVAQSSPPLADVSGTSRLSHTP